MSRLRSSPKTTKSICKSKDPLFKLDLGPSVCLTQRYEIGEPRAQLRWVFFVLFCFYYYYHGRGYDEENKMRDAVCLRCRDESDNVGVSWAYNFIFPVAEENSHPKGANMTL